MQMGPSEVMVTALSAGQSFSDSKSLKSDEQKKSEKFRDLLPPAPLLVKVGRAYSSNILRQVTHRRSSGPLGRSLICPHNQNLTTGSTVPTEIGSSEWYPLFWCSDPTSLADEKVKKIKRLRSRAHKGSLGTRFPFSMSEDIFANGFSKKLWNSSTEVQLKKTKKWICYGKRVGVDELLPPKIKEALKAAPVDGTKTPLASITSGNENGQGGPKASLGFTVLSSPITQIMYDQQNMIQCFEDRNFYRLLFAFFHSMYNSLENQLPSVFRSKDLLTEEELLKAQKSRRQFQGLLEKGSTFFSFLPLTRVSKGATFVLGEPLSAAAYALKVGTPSNPRLKAKKLILFGRSEVKRVFRKILFIKPESILFSQIFLIPLAGFFGILYTFWTFSVSSTVTFKDYIPIAQQRISPLKKRLQFTNDTSQRTSGQDGRKIGSIDFVTKSSTDWSQISVESLDDPSSFDSGTLGLEELPFFTSYKVDWSPTRGLADFLRFTNTASKVFILWASLTVFRSLRPVKANRPEMRIQTRFLRPFQNRKRFRDLEGIEKFSGVLTTLTESIQGSFKDPLFYLVLALPNLPFFQPFQKAIGKFRFFLFYGKQTEFLRKPLSFFFSFFFPKQKQAQRYPKGYLFIGPPGTGKTLLAQAIAGESKVNLICLSASEIQKQLDIGTRIGALRLRNLFEEARTLTPCILFFDEIDTLGRARQNLPESNLAQGSDGQHHRELRWKEFASTESQNWRITGPNRKNNDSQSSWPGAAFRGCYPTHETGSEPTRPEVPLAPIDLKLFTEFLVQMDSFSVKDGFLVIGTTNFLSSLDPAFIRSGRFDRILGLTYPPKQTRIAILKLHIKKKGNLFDPKIPWNIFGLKTKDLSPADLAKVVNESSLYLLNHLQEPISSAASTAAVVLAEAGPTQVQAQLKLGLVNSTNIQLAHSKRPPDSSTSQQPMKSAPQNTRLVKTENFVCSVQNIFKDLFLFQPGLIHTSKSLRQGLVKILESKK